VSRPRSRRSRLAEQVGAGPELVVLTDGPWRGRWYWADELAAIQEAARRYPPEDAAGQLQSYRLSTDRVSHPDEPEITGTAHCYQPAGEEQTRRCSAPDASAGPGPVPRIPALPRPRPLPPPESGRGPLISGVWILSDQDGSLTR
jgi:hypothetical protein